MFKKLKNSIKGQVQKALEKNKREDSSSEGDEDDSVQIDQKMMDKIIMLYNNPQIKRTPIEDELVSEYVKTR